MEKRRRENEAICKQPRGEGTESFRERVREQSTRETRKLECRPEKGQAPAPSGYDRAGTLISSRRLWLPT